MDKVAADSRGMNKSKLASSNSTNPNLNDEISKELGMKPAERVAPCKPLALLKTRSLQRASKSEEDTVDGKEPAKPPLGRTKTPPHIVKGSTAKEANEATARPATKLPLDTALRSKQNPDGSLKGTKQGSNANMDATGQASNANQADKQDSRANVNRLSLKTVPCSPKDNGGKFNSPDLVSSCSSANQTGTKSPDVLGSNPKLSFHAKNVQKTPTLPRGSSPKSPSTPFKPLSIASKATALAEKKKSPTTGNANKSLSSTKEPASKTSQQPKLAQKTEAKSGDSGAKINTVQRAAGGKSNVASLQQKFEANKNVNAPRTVPSIHKKTVGKATEAVGVKK